jgi:hypothetical protein
MRGSIMWRSQSVYVQDGLQYQDAPLAAPGPSDYRIAARVLRDDNVLARDVGAASCCRRRRRRHRCCGSRCGYVQVSGATTSHFVYRYYTDPIPRQVNCMDFSLAVRFALRAALTVNDKRADDNFERIFVQ